MNCHPDDNYTLLQGLDLCGSYVCEAGEPGGEKVSHKPIAGPRDLWTDSAPGLIVDRLHAMQGSRKWAHKALSLGESRRNVSIGNAARTRHLSASPRAPCKGAPGASRSTRKGSRHLAKLHLAPGSGTDTRARLRPRSPKLQARHESGHYRRQPPAFVP